MKTLKLPIILTVILVVFAFLFVGEIKAGTGDNVSGWAWIGTDCTDPTETTCETKTNPVSWISFNDTNSEITCSGIFYGVNVDYSTGEISGAAWIGVGEDNVYTDCNTSENTVGWLYFDSVSTPSCGTGGYPSDYCFPVKIVGNEIHGWAPIISKDSYGAQTTVTWVRFEGSQYSVKINSDGTVGSGSAATDHYAWSNFGREGGLGWIDLARVRFPALNQPPSATNLSVDPPNPTDYCGITGYPPVRLRWQFSDPGDSQSAYQIQVATSSGFSPLVLDTGKITGQSPAFVIQSPYSTLSWNTTYYWRLKVWDSQDTPSTDWIVYQNNIPPSESFTTASHSYPYSNFTLSPQNPAIGGVVTFIDNSKCYSSPGNTEYSCSTGGSISYLWDFGNGQTSTIKGNATTTYTTTGSKTVRLTITDNSLFPAGSCDTTRQVTVALSLPEYKEVPPVIWLKSFFAGIVEFFNGFLKPANG